MYGSVLKSSELRRLSAFHVIIDGIPDIPKNDGPILY